MEKLSFQRCVIAYHQARISGKERQVAGNNLTLIYLKQPMGLVVLSEHAHQSQSALPYIKAFR